MCDCVCAQRHWVMDFVDELCCMHLAHQWLSTVTPYWSCLHAVFDAEVTILMAAFCSPRLFATESRHVSSHFRSSPAPNPTSGPRHLPSNPSKFYRRNSSFHPCRTRRHGSLKSHGLWNSSFHRHLMALNAEYESFMTEIVWGCAKRPTTEVQPEVKFCKDLPFYCKS